VLKKITISSRLSSRGGSWMEVCHVHIVQWLGLSLFFSAACCRDVRSDQRLCSQVLFNLVARFLFSHAMTERAAFCFSKSLSWFGNLMLFCYMTALPRRRN